MEVLKNNGELGLGESQIHMHLVDVIYNKVSQIIPEDNLSMIQKDCPEDRSYRYKVNSFIPDVFYIDKDLIIIGEAKTINDFATKHSQKQIEAYIEECTKFNGMSILIIAVPWLLKNTTINYFKRIQRNRQLNICKIFILDELGRCFEV